MVSRYDVKTIRSAIFGNVGFEKLLVVAKCPTKRIKM
jgi:hypothetical protein